MNTHADSLVAARRLVCGLLQGGDRDQLTDCPCHSLCRSRVRWRASRGARRLPLAEPLPCTADANDVVYGFGRIDASGRIADRAVTGALGWSNGDRLTLTAEAGVVVVRRDPGGMVTVPVRPYVVIPAALRRRCGLRAGDRVLLAAVLREDVLAAYPLAVVDQAIRAHCAMVIGSGGAR